MELFVTSGAKTQVGVHSCSAILTKVRFVLKGRAVGTFEHLRVIYGGNDPFAAFVTHVEVLSTVVFPSEHKRAVAIDVVVCSTFANECSCDTAIEFEANALRQLDTFVRCGHMLCHAIASFHENEM